MSSGKDTKSIKAYHKEEMDGINSKYAPTEVKYKVEWPFFRPLNDVASGNN
jgi:hypothetical protein